MISGNSAILAFGKESTYATKVEPEKKVQFSSADFKATYNKVDTGLLTGGKSKSTVETMSVATEGSISTLAKPETVGHFLYGALGVELNQPVTVNEVAKYAHKFTAIGNAENDYLPSYTFVLDRKVTSNAYDGMTVNSLSMSAESEGYLSVEASYIGHCSSLAAIPETAGSAETGKAFKFHQASVTVNNEELEATSLSLAINNNLAALHTTKTGLYSTHPQQGQREITAELSVIYSAGSEALRNQFWAQDNTLKIKMEFTDDNDNSLVIEIPVAQITAFDEPAVSGTDTLQQSISLTAVDSDQELITVTLTNGRETNY